MRTLLVMMVLVVGGCDGDEPDRPELWYFDGDGDGFIGFDPGSVTDDDERLVEGFEAPSGTWVRSEDAWNRDTDCDDEDPTVFPGADEVCDGFDNDCSGAADDVDACVTWTGDFVLTVVEARAQVSQDLTNASDFLVTVVLDDVTVIRTNVVMESEAPVWNDSAEVTVTSGSSLRVQLADRDEDLFGIEYDELVATWSLDGAELGAFLETAGEHRLETDSGNTWVSFVTARP